MPHNFPFCNVDFHITYPSVTISLHQHFFFITLTGKSAPDFKEVALTEIRSHFEVKTIAGICKGEKNNLYL